MDCISRTKPLGFRKLPSSESRSSCVSVKKNGAEGGRSCMGSELRDPRLAELEQFVNINRHYMNEEDTYHTQTGLDTLASEMRAALNKGRPKDLQQKKKLPVGSRKTQNALKKRIKEIKREIEIKNNDDKQRSCVFWSWLGL